MSIDSHAKIEYWKSQLLDLGKRNKMVNYRETARSTLKIVAPEFTSMYKKLVQDEDELVFQYLIDII